MASGIESTLAGGMESRAAGGMERRVAGGIKRRTVRRSRAFGPAALLTLAALLLAAAPLAAQAKTQVPPPVPGAPRVVEQRITVHSPALVGNLEGESPNRTVLVFLPPGYHRHPHRRYPVLYALHGFFIGAEQWTHEIHVPETIANAYARGARPMIVVLPDSKTVYGGSMYSASPTAGNFERFIAHDLVRYMDTHYRTIPNRLSRGLVGHSMGGYGALRIGMQHPGVFSSLYVMSPCCLAPMTGQRPGFGPKHPPSLTKLLQGVTSPADAVRKTPWFLHPLLALAAAWSPDPDKPPLYFDLPFQNGKPRPRIMAEWAANSPLAMLDQYIANLRRYRAIALDAGDHDPLRFDTMRVHRILDSYHIANTLEIYPGTHTSHVAYRFQNHVLPFFSRHLCFTAHCRPRRAAVRPVG